MMIRREHPDDAPAVRTVDQAAFDRPELAGALAVEARLVDELRADGDSIAALSLVAEHDGRVVGHVVCSRAFIDRRPWLGLGPIGVRPDSQRCGVGRALMHAVIAAADALDEPTIVLLGHPESYPRFGFEPAVDVGITPPHDLVSRALLGAPDECMVARGSGLLPLRAHIRADMTSQRRSSRPSDVSQDYRGSVHDGPAGTRRTSSSTGTGHTACCKS